MTNHIVSIVEIESRFRKAKNIDEVYLLSVNLFRNLFEYEMAISFHYDGNFSAKAHSDVPELNKKSAFVLNIVEKLKKMELSKTFVCDSLEISDDLKKQNIDYILVVPFIEYSTKQLQGVVLYCATKGFSKESTIIAEHCSETISLVLTTLLKRKKISISNFKKYAIFGIIFFAIMMFPVHISTQGKAQIVAKEPTIVTAPVNGVIKKVNVKGNEYVKTGNVLLLFDDMEMNGKLQIAAQTINISSAEAKKQERASFFDSGIKNKLEESIAEKAVKSMEYNAISSQLRKFTVYAPANGMVVLDDPLELVGKPVKTGEKLLNIVDPAKVEVEILISAYESNIIRIGDQVNIYLDNNPMQSLIGEIYKIYYEPIVSPAGILSYKAFAYLNNNEKMPSIGMCGNIKIKGEKVSLFWYLFRKPISYMRWYFG